MLRRLSLALAVLALLAAAAGTASAHRHPCHPQHGCPSDHHTYAWNGLWCTSYADERLPEDTRTVHWDGRTYWCHGSGSGRPAGDLDAGSGATCGMERWAVKTLQDPAARNVSLLPQMTTVAALRRLRPPEGGSSSRSEVELHSYRVKAHLLAAKIEDDSDIHLVIADPRSGGSMIVGFPAFGCTKRAMPAARKLMQLARVALLHACGDPGSGSFTELRGTATIVGVGFFDLPHGQRGAAPSQIELHPVIAFQSSNCRSLR